MYGKIDKLLYTRGMLLECAYKLIVTREREGEREKEREQEKDREARNGTKGTNIFITFALNIIELCITRILHMYRKIPGERDGDMIVNLSLL